VPPPPQQCYHVSGFGGKDGGIVKLNAVLKESMLYSATADLSGQSSQMCC
jgi:hypothetical protein